MHKLAPLALAATLVAAAAVVVPPADAQQAAAPMTVLGPARSGPGAGTQRVVTPASSTETASDIGRRLHTHYRLLVEPQGGAAATAMATTPKVGPPYPGYLIETPGSLACIYRLVATTPGCNPNVATAVPTGGSRMIAIVDAHDLPTAAADLQAFSTQFGLPAANFRVVYATGTQPSFDAGWALEEALDIEMAHAMAPNAQIVLVEAASASLDDLGVAIDVAYNLVAQAGGGQVSMSFGGSEFSTEGTFETHFAKQGFVTFYASSGDSAGTSYPSTSPNVVAVGGTATSRVAIENLTNYGDFVEETAWADAGSGFSSVFVRPSYQRFLAQRYYYAGTRSVPDVAAVASNLTPVWVYCSICTATPGWYAVSGTSVASPLTAGMANKWGAFHQSSQAALQSIYANAGTRAFFNPTLGVCGPNGGYFSSRGYDLCTGLGTPRSAKAF